MPVGQTSRDPDWRFDQHKSGYKAGRTVKWFGVRALPWLTEHLNPMHGWEAIDLEAALAVAFSSTFGAVCAFAQHETLRPRPVRIGQLL